MLRNNFILTPIISLLLIGCATPVPPGVQVQIQKVEVPIQVPCNVKIPSPPAYNFNGLKTTDDIFQKNQALLADRDLSLGYEDQLTTALNACVK